MKPTPTQIEAAARAMCEADGVDPDGDLWEMDSGRIINPAWIDYEAKAIAGLSAALSVPAEAVVGEPERDAMRRRIYADLAKEGGGTWATYVCMDIVALEDAAFEAGKDAAPSAPEGWQPIETAPRDRTAIILALKGARVTVGHWLDNSKTQWPWQGWSTDAGPMIEAKVTHWRPLPSPPGEKP